MSAFFYESKKVFYSHLGFYTQFLIENVGLVFLVIEYIKNKLIFFSFSNFLLHSELAFSVILTHLVFKYLVIG